MGELYLFGAILNGATEAAEIWRKIRHTISLISQTKDRIEKIVTERHLR
jgi:hypothetical protein